MAGNIGTTESASGAEAAKGTSEGGQKKKEKHHIAQHCMSKVNNYGDGVI